jgi:hypothetical protein
VDGEDSEFAGIDSEVPESRLDNREARDMATPPMRTNAGVRGRAERLVKSVKGVSEGG